MTRLPVLPFAAPASGSFFKTKINPNLRRTPKSPILLYHYRDRSYTDLKLGAMKKEKSPQKRELFKILDLITFSKEKRLDQALHNKNKSNF
jgi:hypothetical protein